MAYLWAETARPTRVVTHEGGGTLYQGAIATLHDTAAMQFMNPRLIVSCFDDAAIAARDLAYYRSALVVRENGETQFVMPRSDDARAHLQGVPVVLFRVPRVRGWRSMPDRQCAPFRGDLATFCARVYACLASGGNVLVHCIKGLKRSMPLVAAVIFACGSAPDLTSAFKLAVEIRAEDVPAVSRVCLNGYISCLIDENNVQRGINLRP